MIVRQACFEDAEGIAKVQVDSWRTTYRGIVSDAVLSGLSVEGRKKSWEWTFRNPKPDEALFVAEDDAGIVGFSNGGKSRYEEYGHDGELYAIYILESHQRRGVGKELVRAAADHLRAAGYKSLMVWVLERNPSIAFYKRLGGVELGRKDIIIGEDRLIEVALGWSAIDDIRF